MLIISNFYLYRLFCDHIYHGAKLSTCQSLQIAIRQTLRGYHHHHNHHEFYFTKYEEDNINTVNKYKWNKTKAMAYARASPNSRE